MRRIAVAAAYLAGLLLSVHGARADGVAATKYPIFLAEGFGGLDYLGIKEALSSAGADVCDPPDDQVPHFAGSEPRADVLIGQIEACAQAFGVSRVNLIGYSLGGMDARVVLARRPDLLASVTTVGSPHRHSSGIADRVLACGAKQQLGLPCAADEIGATAAFAALGQVATDPDAPAPALEELIQANCQISSGLNPLAVLACLTSGYDTGPVFNLKYAKGMPLSACGEGPAFVFGPGFRRIYLYSWGGAQLETDAGDPSDPFLVGTSAFIDGANDGLAQRCGTHFGDVLRDDYPLNHLDLINQLQGLTGGFDVPDLYVEHAARLKARGL